MHDFECDVDDAKTRADSSLSLTLLYSLSVFLVHFPAARSRLSFCWFQMRRRKTALFFRVDKILLSSSASLLCLFRLFCSFFLYLFLQFVFRFYWALLTRLNVGCFKHHHSWCYESYVRDVMYAVVPALLLLLLSLSLPLRIVKFHTYNRYDVWMARSLCILCVSKCERA